MAERITEVRIERPKAQIRPEHGDEAQQLVNAYSSGGAFLEELVHWIAQAIADAEARGAPGAHSQDVRQAAQRVGAFLAAREGMSGMDPTVVTGVGAHDGIRELTVADLATLAGLA